MLVAGVFQYSTHRYDQTRLNDENLRRAKLNMDVPESLLKRRHRVLMSLNKILYSKKFGLPQLAMLSHCNVGVT